MTTETKTEKTEIKKLKPVVKGGPGKPDLYSPWDLHIVGLDDECGEEAAFYDPRVLRPIDDTFTDSITADGIMEPVEVCSPTDPRVVFGRKRVSAARIASSPPPEGRGKQVLVPVVFSPAGLTMAEAESRVFTENIQRINDDALTIADKVAAFLKRNGDAAETRQTLARSLGLKPAAIPSLLKLRKADDAVKSKIKKGELGIVAGLRLASLPQHKQAEVVNKAAAMAVARKEKEVAKIRAQREKAAAKKAAKAGSEPKEKKSKLVSVDEAVEVLGTAKPAKRGKDITLRDVETVIASDKSLAKKADASTVRPRVVDIREVLELLRENPFLDDGVSAEAILMWVVGDEPCPFDLTLVADKQEEAA